MNLERGPTGSPCFFLLTLETSHRTLVNTNPSLGDNMPTFDVDDDVAAAVERLARPRPFENLSFNAALRRVLEGLGEVQPQAEVFDFDELMEESNALFYEGALRGASPNAADWAATVPDLRGRTFESWQAICDALGIEVGGDSARRRLQAWVASHRPGWPQVLEVAERPTGGKDLYRFTDKWLRDEGLFDGKSIARRRSEQIAGKRAVRYHLDQGNFTDAGGRIALTQKGREYFLARRQRFAD